MFYFHISSATHSFAFSFCVFFSVPILCIRVRVCIVYVCADDKNSNNINNDKGKNVNGSIYEPLALQILNNCSFINRRNIRNIYPFQTPRKQKKNKRLNYEQKAHSNIYACVQHKGHSLFSQFEQITNINNASSLIKLKSISIPATKQMYEHFVKNSFIEFRQNTLTIAPTPVLALALTPAHTKPFKAVVFVIQINGNEK